MKMEEIVQLTQAYDHFVQFGLLVKNYFRKCTSEVKLFDSSKLLETSDFRDQLFLFKNT